MRPYLFDLTVRVRATVENGLPDDLGTRVGAVRCGRDIGGALRSMQNPMVIVQSGRTVTVDDPDAAMLVHELLLAMKGMRRKLDKWEETGEL